MNARHAAPALEEILPPGPGPGEGDSLARRAARDTDLALLFDDGSAAAVRHARAEINRAIVRILLRKRLPGLAAVLEHAAGAVPGTDRCPGCGRPRLT